MIPRPPRSPLFPYTRSSDLGLASDGQARDARRFVGAVALLVLESLVTVDVRRIASDAHGAESLHFPQRADERRSEEHTSELQSRLHLVCRLLLEKKNNKRPE